MSKRNVIITGVSSFVGMHLARVFSQANNDVCAVISRPIACYDGIRGERLAAIAEQVSFEICDLTDNDAVGGLIKKVQPDLWVHHAGYAENYGSRDYDLEKSLTINVVALEPLYKCLAGTGCNVIVTGTSMEYTSGDTADREDDICWPDLPYGVSKLAETVEAHRLSLQYKIPTRVARIYIPVGPFDAPGKLIDSVIGALLKGESVDLSPCTQKRDFMGVDDIASAYFKLAEDMPRINFDVFNVCSGQARELRELLLNLCSIIGADPALLNFGAREMRPGEPLISYGSNDKAVSLLNWQPNDLIETLRTLVAESQNKRTV